MERQTNSGTNCAIYDDALRRNVGVNQLCRGVEEGESLAHMKDALLNLLLGRKSGRGKRARSESHQLQFHQAQPGVIAVKTPGWTDLKTTAKVPSQR